jgi:hypothetical protein
MLACLQWRSWLAHGSYLYNSVLFANDIQGK